jgi:hypothetical protein
MDPQVATNLRRNIDDLYVSHELRKREAAGCPFSEDIWAAQVLLPPAGGEPTVRLNREVRLRVRTIASDEWIDYLAVPTDGSPQIRQVDLYPEESGVRHLTYCRTAVTPEQLVWFSVGEAERRQVERPAHARAAANARFEEAWSEMLHEHDRVADLILAGINSPTPEMPIEVIAATVLQRSRAHLQAFVALLAQRNLLAASALIRMQLDSVMRMNACFLVDDPMDLWNVLREGRGWGSVRDRDGKKLRDVYLHEKLSERFDWASDVYDRMSAYIHLSRPHLEAPAEGEDFLGMRIFQGATGAQVTDEELYESAEVLMKVTSALLTLCEEYVYQRRAGEL